MPDFFIRYDTLDGLPIIDSPVATWSQKAGNLHLHAFVPTPTGKWRSLCSSVTVPQIAGADLSLPLCTDCDFKEARLRRLGKQEKQAAVPPRKPEPPPAPVVAAPRFEPGAIRRRSLQRQGADI